MLGTTVIEVPSWGNMTAIEAIWLASGLLAMFVTLLHIRLLYQDWRIMLATGRPLLIETSWAYLRRETIRLLQGLCLVVIGAYAAVEPQAIPGKPVVTLVGLVLTVVLLTMALLISVQSLLDWRTRQTLETLIRQGQNGHRQAVIASEPESLQEEIV